jgi:hypothetical protein
MIVTLPDNGVSAPLTARNGNSTDKNEGVKSQSTAARARDAAPRDAAGHALQTLFNVTIDCVRGRYDR